MERSRVFISSWAISSLALDSEYQGKVLCSNRDVRHLLIKCETSAVGEQTKVMIEYNAFSLFNLVDVHISVPSREASLDKPINEVGSCSYDPGKAKEHSKVHWFIPAIDESNRKTHPCVQDSPCAAGTERVPYSDPVWSVEQEQKL
ncbi:hypothetical protein Tco_1375484 [Tanacetum coccineum]